LTRLLGMHDGVGDELADEQADDVTAREVELEGCKPLGDEGTSPRGSIQAGRQVRAQRRPELGKPDLIIASGPRVAQPLIPGLCSGWWRSVDATWLPATADR
jgi:hypothetical protein